MIARWASFLPILGAVLLTFAGISPDLHAADIKERTIKLPVVTAIDHPLGIGASKFAELVAQKSNGKMGVPSPNPRNF